MFLLDSALPSGPTTYINLMQNVSSLKWVPRRAQQEALFHRIHHSVNNNFNIGTEVTGGKVGTSVRIRILILPSTSSLYVWCGV